MTFETDKLIIGDVIFNYIESQELTGDRIRLAPVKGRLKSADITCKGCKLNWTSHQFGKGSFSSALGYVIFECPSCSVRDSVGTNLLG